MGNSPITLDFSKAQPLTLDFSKAQPIEGAKSFGEGTNVTNKPEEYAAKALSAAGLPTSIANIPEWFRNLKNLNIQHLFIDPIKKAINDPSAENIAATVPYFGQIATSAAKDVRENNYGGAAATVAGGLLGAKATGEVAPGLKAAATEAPEIVAGGWRKIGNPMGLASTGQELLTQGISPRTSMVNFGPSLEKAAGDLKAYDEASPIKNVHDLNDAIPEIKQKIWNEEVEPALQRQAAKPVNMHPVAEAVRNQITDEMREFDEGNAAKLESFANKLENARDVTSANKLLKYANGQLNAYFQKFPASRKANLMDNPETAGWEAARAELRNQFLNTMEDAGEEGVRDARLRYGAMDTLQDAVERRVNVADRAKPMSLGRIVGLAAAAPTAGLSIIAGEISNYLNKPDVLIRRGIKKLD